MNVTSDKGVSAVETAMPASQTPKNPEASHAAYLPNRPLITIEPSSHWKSLELRTLWAYRELFYFLTWRDVKVRYKQTVLGAAWAIIQPVLTMLIFTVFFGRLAGIPSDDIPYPLFAYAGLLSWTFFSNAINNSGNSLVGSAHLITKVYFPRQLIPAASVAAGLVDFGIAFIPLLALMLYYGVALSWQLLMLPVLVILTTLLALGVGMWLSALNVKYRDVRFALPFLTQIWLYLSPIAYPASMLPAKWRLIYTLNPMTGLIEGYRAALFGRAFDWPALGISTAITLFVLIYAAFAFRSMERNFADIV